MAKEVLIKCDIDGTVGATTHRVTVDEKVLVIDLSEASFAKLERALAPFYKVGSVTVRTSNGVDAELAQIREWLVANGHSPAPKGRISQAHMDLYHAAHPETPPETPAS